MAFNKLKISDIKFDDEKLENLNIRERAEDLKNNLINMFNGSKGEAKLKIPYNCLGFFGCAGGVGTTTVCWELANLFAEDDWNVCIVDLNLTKPGMCTRYLQKRIDNNIKTYLDGGCELGDILVKAKKNIDFVESATYIYNELIEIDNRESYSNMKELISMLKKYYDIVFIDYNVDLLFFDLVQGALKETTNLIGIVNDGTSSYFNKHNVELMLKQTSAIQPLFVMNMHEDTLRIEDDYFEILPFDSNVKISDVMGKCYNTEGNSEYKDLGDAYRELVKKLYIEMGLELER